MSQQLTKTNGQELINWTDAKQLDEIRKIFAPKLSETEFAFFCGMSKATKLNPFLREIWCVKYQENSPAQVFIGRDGYRKAAQSHFEYDYHQSDAVYENDNFEVVCGEVRHSYKLASRGKLVGAYCITKRKSSSKPIYIYVPLNEYSTGKSLWNNETGKPSTMIKKVAESQCLRAAFQELFAGTYSEEEKDSMVDFSQTEKLNAAMNNDSEQENNLITDEQLTQIEKRVKEIPLSEEDKNRVFDYLKVKSLNELTQKQLIIFQRYLDKNFRKE